jgi:CBS domain-containing protein
MERTSGFEQFFDVRRQVEQHPWLMIGGATLAGIVAGRVATSLLSECFWTTPSSTTLGRSFRRSAEPMTEGTVEGEDTRHEQPGFFSDLATMAVSTLAGAARDLARQTLPESLSSKIEEIADSARGRQASQREDFSPFRGGTPNGGAGRRGSTGGRRVRNLMTPDPACCTKDTSLTDVARLMVEHDCGAIPVVESNENGRLVGVVTDRDIVCRTLANGEDPYQMAAGDCMSEAPITVRPDTSLEECARKMEQHQLRRILVLDASGRCCGIVAQADLARHADETRTGDVVKNVSQSGEPAFGAL